MSTSRVSIGVAGWSYADWRRIVYPPGCADPLRAVAELVPLLEVNSSFYRVPDAETVAGWERRSRPLGTRFTAKLPQAVTHHGDRDAALARDFCAAFAPLAAADRLDGLLAQFSFRFRAIDAGAFELLAWIRDRFGPLAPRFLEVRDRSWRDVDAQRRARELGFHLVDLDYPGARTGFAAPRTPETERAYLRMHGRNRAAWFDKDAGRDATYDYLYPAAEVAALAGRLDSLARSAGSVHAVANNHFRGQAVKLALELIARHEGRRVDVPQCLADTYPDLARIARRAQGDLFGRDAP